MRQISSTVQIAPCSKEQGVNSVAQPLYGLLLLIMLSPGSEAAGHLDYEDLEHAILAKGPELSTLNQRSDGVDV